MPKPFDLDLHKSYNVNNKSKNYKSFTGANGEQWYTDRPLITYNNSKLAYVTNGRNARWVTVGNEFNTQPQMLSREQAVKRDLNKPRIQAANDLTQGLTDLITGGMAGSLREGAQNLTKGNYIKGISQLATPAMFGSGIAGNIARAGVGSYNLLNEDGVRKTYKYINNKEYGNAAYHGNGLTPDELKYLRFKTHQAFIDKAEAGPYDFHQQTGEAAMNGRDLGHDLGISVGQSYPGYQKALETLNSGLGKSTKDGMIKLFKTDEQSMPYVWKLLNGTLLGGALVTKFNNK